MVSEPRRRSVSSATWRSFSFLSMSFPPEMTSPPEAGRRRARTPHSPHLDRASALRLPVVFGGTSPDLGGHSSGFRLGGTCLRLLLDRVVRPARVDLDPRPHRRRQRHLADVAA